MVSLRELAYSNTESMARISLNHEEADVSDCEKVVVTLLGVGNHLITPAKLDIYMKNYEMQPGRLSIEVPQKLKFKELPSHLKYAFFGENDTFLVVVAIGLQEG